MSLLNRPHKYQLPPVLYAQITKWNRREVDDLTMADFLDDFFKLNHEELLDETTRRENHKFLYHCLMGWVIRIGESYYGRQIRFYDDNERRLRRWIKKTFENYCSHNWILMLDLLRAIKPFLKDTFDRDCTYEDETLVDAVANPSSLVPYTF